MARRRKSLNDIAEQIGRINRNYNTRRYRDRINRAANNLQKKALERTSIGRLMKQLVEAEARQYGTPSSPSYSNASQRLNWLSQAGNKEATKALNATRASYPIKGNGGRYYAVSAALGLSNG